MGCIHGKCCRKYVPWNGGECCRKYVPCNGGEWCRKCGEWCRKYVPCKGGECCRKYVPCKGGEKKKKENLGKNDGHGTAEDKALGIVHVPSHNYRLEYSVFTQRGYYPETPDKDNQDSYCVKTQIKGNPNVHFFGVFDGHGQYGTQCSEFVKDRLVQILSDDAELVDNPIKVYNTAFLATNDELHNSEIEDSMSGTTGITALVIGDMLYVANVGDSRAVLAIKDGNKIVAEDLSFDQTPFRKDECERVKLCGARVLSVDQVEGIKDPDIQTWGDEETEGGDPPRLWVQDGMYPGTAFTRSVGDSIAESIGVVSVPEVAEVHLTSSHQFFVIASDGVFEFLSSQKVIDMVSQCKDPTDAGSAIASEAYKLWLEHENRTDDITIIIVHIKDLSNFTVVNDESSQGSSRLEALRRKNGTSGNQSGIFFAPSLSSEVYHSMRIESSGRHFSRTLH